MDLTILIGLGAGLFVGTTVTFGLHQGLGWPVGFWGRRLGRTRFRYANVPIGGAFFGGLAVSLGSESIGAAAIGMAVSAMGFGLYDPLLSWRP